MSAQDDEHLYSLPYERVPVAPDDYNGLINKPKINGYTLEGDKSAADYGINVPTKVSDLTNDADYATRSEIPTQLSQLANNVGFTTQAYVDDKIERVTGAIPTKVSQLTNDSGFITASDLPTKTSELTNDSDYTTKTYVDTEIGKIPDIKGLTLVKNIKATETFTSTFDNLATNLQAKYAALKTALQSGESIELKSLVINTIGNLKPSHVIIIDSTTDISSLIVDWQGFAYNNNVVQAIDVINKKVLNLTMTNDLNNDAFVSYFEDATAYTFNIEYTKYITIPTT